MCIYWVDFRLLHKAGLGLIGYFTKEVILYLLIVDKLIILYPWSERK